MATTNRLVRESRNFALGAAFIPGTPGILVRRLLFSSMLNECGDDFTILQGGMIYSPDRVTIGDDVSIGNYTIIEGAFGVEIGNQVRIGPGCMIESVTHNFSRTDIPMSTQGYSGEKIVIGNDVWIGANVTVVKGSKIGQGSVIGANSVVIGEIQPYGIYVGAPAIKKRDRAHSDK